MWRNFKRDINQKLNRHKVEHPVSYACMKWFLIFLIILLVILLVLFILTFVVFPILFMTWLALERLLVFMNVNVPKDPKFDKPLDYGFKGVTNFYVTSKQTKDSEEILSIGAWWVPQENYINSNESMNDILERNEYPVVLYNHGVYATRILKIPYVYATLRKFFHVVAIDYRDYGDSTPHDLTEEGVVLDVVHTYFLMKQKTKADIYVWGHSLGGGISTHAVKMLKDSYEEIPAGLVVESSFTTLEEEVYEFFFGKYFKWLPWFEWCVTDALRNHGFIFNTTKNIQDVDCPIMIMHAEDDNVIPYKIGEKNYNLTKSSRKPGQGKVFFHHFPADKHYEHIGCTQDPEVPNYIKEFMAECNNWKVRNSV